MKEYCIFFCFLDSFLLIGYVFLENKYDLEGELLRIPKQLPKYRQTNWKYQSIFTKRKFILQKKNHLYKTNRFSQNTLRIIKETIYISPQNENLCILWIKRFIAIANFSKFENYLKYLIFISFQLIYIVFFLFHNIHNVIVLFWTFFNELNTDEIILNCIYNR